MISRRMFYKAAGTPGLHMPLPKGQAMFAKLLKNRDTVPVPQMRTSDRYCRQKAQRLGDMTYSSPTRDWAGKARNPETISATGSYRDLNWSSSKTYCSLHG